MLYFVLRRLGVMLLTAFALTFIVFYMTNLPPNLEKLAKSEASVRMDDDAVASWLERNGHGGPVLLRYAQWIGLAPGWTRVEEDGSFHGRCVLRDVPPEETPRYCGVLQGDWGASTVFKQPVSEVLARSLGATGWLMLWVMIVMVPTSLLLGVLSGMREGSRTDRVLSTFAIATTATPEYVSGVVLIALLASTTTGGDSSEVKSRVNAILGRPLSVNGAVQIALLNNRRLRATLEDVGISQAELVEALAVGIKRYFARNPPLARQRTL